MQRKRETIEHEKNLFSFRFFHLKLFRRKKKCRSRQSKKQKTKERKKTPKIMKWEWKHMHRQVLVTGQNHIQCLHFFSILNRILSFWELLIKFQLCYKKFMIFFLIFFSFDILFMMFPFQNHFIFKLECGHNLMKEKIRFHS